jgi:hypothetical protein
VLRPRISVGLALASALGAGCQHFDPPPPPPQTVLVRATSDPGVPLAEVVLRFGGKEVGKTDAEGLGKLKLEGREGESFDIAVACPEGSRSPTRPLQVTLRRLAGDKLPEYFVSCPPLMRSVVVAVRAENAPGLPILYLGREVARTDGSGAAHVHLRLKPDEPFELMLQSSTDDPDADEFRPRDPTASFVMKDHDDIVSFDQKFERVPKPKRGGGGRRGPVRIP